MPAKSNDIDAPWLNGFRALTELAPDLVALVDATGVIRYISPAVTRVLGYLPREVVGHPFIDFVHPDDQARGREDFARILGTKEVVAATLRYLHKDQSWRVLETLARNHVDVPTLEAVLVSTRDVSGHVATERLLRASLLEVEDLYNNAPCGYHSVDEHGVIVRINDTELSWLGYSRQEIVGKKGTRDLLSASSRPTYERQFPNFKNTGSLRDLELELLRKDGTSMPVLMSATAIKDAAGSYIASRSVLYDITERKQSEAALRRVNRALRVLSAVSQELGQARNETALFGAVCRVLVDLGGYRMAWVGLAQHDAGRTVRPAAQSGFEAGYLEGTNFSWADTEHGRGPTGAAIRTGTLQVNHDFLTDPRMAPWRDEALKRGYQSSVALPLVDVTGPFGALMIYAVEASAFDSEELDLLRELASDLSLGVTTLRTREEKRLADELIERLAYFDTLTGLPNRVSLFTELERAVAAKPHAQSNVAILMMVVDGFVDIQTGIGVREADGLLKQIADRLCKGLQADEFLARMGEDAFGIVLPHGDADAARLCASRIAESLTVAFQQAGISLDVRLNIGAAVAPEHSEDPEALIVRSGIAARHAKRSGAGYTLYSGTTEFESPRLLALISELRQAIEGGQLILNYQPKVDVASGRICAAEALVRWRHAERGVVPPGEFIPLAEHTGLIKPLTYRVLDIAIRQLARWREQAFDMPVAVNVSARNLVDPEFPGRVMELLNTNGVKPDLLQLEITESTLMEDPVKAHDLIVRLTSLGIQVSIDDFGTGYSSLSYVATLPIHSLKIDRTFVTQMMTSARTHSVVAATISLARMLGIKTIAEGVETKEQARELVRLHCGELQGFLFSSPVEADELRRMVAAFSFATFGLNG